MTGSHKYLSRARLHISAASANCIGKNRTVWSTSVCCVVGSSWTTDAPFRETAEAIEAARGKGILAVEMEAAALYAFARAAGVRVLCLAHVTNTMGLAGDDFEKGEADGTRDALTVLEATIAALLRS